MTPLTEGGLRDWIRQFCPQARESAGEKSDYVLDYVEEKVKNDLFFDSLWHVDYMRLRFKAIKEKYYGKTFTHDALRVALRMYGRDASRKGGACE